VAPQVAAAGTRVGKDFDAPLPHDLLEGFEGAR